MSVLVEMEVGQEGQLLHQLLVQADLMADPEEEMVVMKALQEAVGQLMWLLYPEPLLRSDKEISITY